jgi:hypothetical protein
MVIKMKGDLVDTKNCFKMSQKSIERFNIAFKKATLKITPKEVNTTMKFNTAIEKGNAPVHYARGLLVLLLLSY